MSFHPAVQRWFSKTFAAPTRVQREGWAAIARGEHALMLAPTGSGKTLAAFLWSLDRLSRSPEAAARGVRVLYVSPLKALVYDVERNLRRPLAGIRVAAAELGEPVRPIGVGVRTGDTSARERRRMPKDPPEVLVTTPESLYLLLGSKAREMLRNVELVIIDEIHVLAPSKRGAWLALSLERLSALCHQDPQRIGLSATQRPLEEVARFLGGDRPVTLVDASAPPDMDLEVVVTVPDLRRPWDRPDADHAELAEASEQRSVWPSIHTELLRLIRAHTSTLIFVNSRGLCERLTKALNLLAKEELAASHHGSLSHARRAEIEDRLKRGELPCMVATSSMELGIDMGAIELVVCVESPGSVAAGLQRVGRAGHAVGERSVGRFFPKHRGDLLEAAAVAWRMRAGEVERIHVLRNPLDVLAQQVVAMVAVEDLHVEELHRRVRRAACWSELSRGALDSVLDMLSGRFPSDDFANLKPRLSWDRANDVLSARKGARMVSMINGGTIPDRGMFGVFLGPKGRRVGELDEEMVFESRPGDVFVLGTSAWRVQEIRQDRVLVSPAPGRTGRLPFWRGEGPGRPGELGQAMGALVREVEARDKEAALGWLAEHAALNPEAGENLLALLEDQRRATTAVPSDRCVVVERSRDELGDWRVCILTSLGAKVHRPWAIAIEANLAERLGANVRAIATDDGVILRLADPEDLGDPMQGRRGQAPPLDPLLPDPDALDELLLEQLRHSALFAARFRECAARALLLTRRNPKQRRPLWAQRKVAAELMAAVQRHPRFPVVLETYRECLDDAFDLPALRALLQGVRSGEVRVVEAETLRPSPLARSLVMDLTGAFMYEADAPAAERRARALSLDTGLLRELVGERPLSELLEPGVLDALEQRLQGLEDLAQDADALHDRLRRLGDLDPQELEDRAAQDPKPWLAQLAAQGRAAQLRFPDGPRWVAAEDAEIYAQALGIEITENLPPALRGPVDAPLEALTRRFARSRGPFEPVELMERYGLSPGAVDQVLRALAERGELERFDDAEEESWIHAEVLRRARRQSLATLRAEIAPVDGPTFARFLDAWAGLDAPAEGPDRLDEALDQLAGLALPLSALEAQLLPARVRGYQSRQLDALLASGAWTWVGVGPLGERDASVALYRREQLGLLRDPPPDEALPPLQAALLDHLATHGACFFTELMALQGADPAALSEALWALVWSGHVSNDTLHPLRQRGAPAPSRGRRRGLRAAPRASAAGGRWSRLIYGQPPAPTARALAQVESLSERYGLIAPELARAEGLGGGFSAIYPLLRELELGGQLRRGWFVEPLGATQFALPGAVDALRAARSRSGARLMAAVDPANPWGAALPWPEHPAGQARRTPGAQVVLVDGALALYLSGERALCFAEGSTLRRAAEALAAQAPRQLRASVTVAELDGQDPLQHPAATLFRGAGFQAEVGALRLRVL